MKLSFEYTVKKHRAAKNLKIKIEPNGKISVTAPPFVPKFIIDQFVKKNAEWIKKNLEKQQSIKTGHTPQFNSKSTVHIFGKIYQKKLDFSLTQKVGMYTRGSDLIFNPTAQPKIQTEDDQKKWDAKFQTKLEQFLKNTAQHYIVARTHALAEKMTLKFNKITLKKQKTRWGSCSSQKNLNFNWQLVHFETPIIDYVIVHELAHLVHMNHSKQFWQLVEKFDPEYRKHVGWLKRNGLNLG